MILSRHDLLRSLVIWLWLCFASLTLKATDKLIFVDPASGEFSEWVRENVWKPIGAGPLSDTTQDRGETGWEYPWGRVRITQDQKVEVLRNGEWKDTGLRPSPRDMTYEKAVIEARGGILVEPGGKGTGFNFILPGGAIIVSHLMSWRGVKPPPLSQIIPYGSMGGFLGLDSKGTVWHIDIPDVGRREFVALPLFYLIPASKLLWVNGSPILRTKTGNYQLIKNMSSPGEDIQFPLRRKGGFIVTNDDGGLKQLRKIAHSTQARAPPAAEEAQVEHVGGGQNKGPNFISRYGITYQQFEDLVKQKVGQIKGLEELWAHNEIGNGSHKDEKNYKVLFGGGRLRGLLLWLDNKLTSGIPLEELQRAAPPALSLLALQPDTDKDIVTLRSGSNYSKDKKWAVTGWDALTESFYEASIDSGGPSLEKLFVSPDEASDPYGALRLFAEGKLDFVFVSPKDYKAVQLGDRMWGNSRIAQALRYLRFLKEFPDHKPTERAKQFLQGLSRMKDPYLLPKKSNNWWVYKGLLRLFGAHNEQLGPFVDTLRKWGLLELLVKQKISTSSSGEIVKPEHIRLADFRGLGFTANDLQMLERFLADNNITGRTALKSHFLGGAKSFKELVHVLDWRTPLGPNSWYREAVNTLLKEALPRVHISEGNLKYFGAAKEFCTDAETTIQLYNLAIPLIKTVGDFMMVIENSSDQYAKETAGWLNDKLDLLESLNPTLKDVERLDRRFGMMAPLSIALKRLALKLARTEKETLWALDYHVTVPIVGALPSGRQPTRAGTVLKSCAWAMVKLGVF